MEIWIKNKLYLHAEKWKVPWTQNPSLLSKVASRGFPFFNWPSFRKCKIKIYQFPVAPVINYHKPNAQNNVNLFYQNFCIQKSKINIIALESRGQQGCTQPESSREGSIPCLFQVNWLAAPSLQSLALSSHFLSPGMFPFLFFLLGLPLLLFYKENF